MGLLPPTIAVVTQPTRLEGLVATVGHPERGEVPPEAGRCPRARPECPRSRRGTRAAETTAELAAAQEAGEAAFASYEQEDRAARHA